MPPQTPNQAPDSPQRPENRPLQLQKLTQPPYLYGIAILALLAILSFTLVFSYLSNSDQKSAQAAAAAAADTKVVDAFRNVDLLADAAIVYDVVTGQTLYAKNADVQLPLASLTKVPLALVVADVLPPESTITIPYDTDPPGSFERLGAGEVWKVKKVINFTLVISSNEGADILAQAAEEPIRAKYPAAPAGMATLWRMNTLVRDLGLSHTYFLNPSGLDESETQSGAYGSARDMAMLFAYAATSSPSVFDGTTQNGLLLSNEDGRVTSAINTNEALGAIPGLIMGKTGFTDLAGGNLGIVFDVGLAHPVAVVVLGSSREGRFSDMKQLIKATREAVIGE